MAKFKELQVGQKVRLVSTKHTGAAWSYTVSMVKVGSINEVTNLTSKGQPVRLNGDIWSYHHKDLEIVVEDAPKPVRTEPVTTAKDVPVGTKVRVLRDQEDGYYKAGAVGTLGRHYGDDKPRIDFLDDFWYPYYDNLEIVPQDTPDTVCKPELEPEPVAAPKELTIEDFVVTRVRVKSTGAKGTVIGHTRSRFVGVQHDVDTEYKGCLGFHECAPQLGDAVGADKRCYWYSPSELEIITEEV